MVEVGARVFRTRATYAELKQLWHLSDVSLKLKGCVYCVAVCPVLFSYESFRGDVRRLVVFGYH